MQIYKCSHGDQFMEVAVQGDLESDPEGQFREAAKEAHLGKCQCRPIWGGGHANQSTKVAVQVNLWKWSWRLVSTMVKVAVVVNPLKSP